MTNILITGGAGYVGTALTARLLSRGHNVLVYDAMFYGNDLASHPRLKVVEGDIRDTATLDQALWGVEKVIHLACISNDPSFELDEGLSKTINFDCFEPMVLAAKRHGVRRFIYASSSSVYGVSDLPDVTEDHPLMPLTLYSKFKGMCEEVLERHRSADFEAVTIRPATVCGYSPHMRLDLSVNILTNHAVNTSGITVFGGSQKRPNLHIEDMIDVYELLLDAEAEKVSGAVFNVGAQNLPIAEIADTARQIVQREFPEKLAITITTTPTNDLRSYHVNSDKIYRTLGFKPKRTIEDAIRDLCAAFQAGKIPNAMTDPRYHNVKVLKSRNAMSASLPLAVVTGGAGFIGSHMVDLLIGRGYRVHVLDNLTGGRAANLSQHERNGRVLLDERDIRTIDPGDALFAGARFVFHFAGIGDIVPSIERPVDYMSVNVQGTVRILEAARAASIDKFVYAASSSCYGMAGVPTSETHPVNPQYPYALSKYQGEQAVLHWAKVYALPANSIRIFNAYGIRSRTSGAYGAVFGVFLRQKLAGVPFTVVGDGTQRRDFLYASDIARAFLAAAETPLSERVWNVGAGRPQSILQLIDLLGGDVVHIPKRPGEPDCTWADVSRIRADLGWWPEVSFEEGVGRVLAAIDYWREAPLWTPDTIAEATRPWFKALGS